MLQAVVMKDPLMSVRLRAVIIMPALPVIRQAKGTSHSLAKQTSEDSNPTSLPVAAKKSNATGLRLV